MVDIIQVGTNRYKIATDLTQKGPFTTTLSILNGEKEEGERNRKVSKTLKEAICAHQYMREHADEI